MGSCKLSHFRFQFLLAKITVGRKERKIDYDEASEIISIVSERNRPQRLTEWCKQGSKSQIIKHKSV